MATSFTIRTAKKTGRSTVIARVQRPETNTDLRLSTHLQVDIDRWRGASSNASKLKNYRKFEPDLWEKLDKIRNSLDVACDGRLTSDEARAIIDSIVRKDEIDEMKAREEARKKRNEENSFIEYYSAFISDAEAGRAKRIGKGKGGNLGIRTIINYKQGLKWLEEYRENRLNGRGISFDDLDQAFFDDYQEYLESRELQSGKYKGQKGCRNNTIAMRLAELKSVLRRAEKAGFPVRSNYSQIDILEDSDVDSIALSRGEIAAIKAVDLSDLPKCYDEARDIFLVGVWTAQRVSDYNGNRPGEGIKPEDIKTAIVWSVEDVEGKKVAKEQEVIYVDIRQHKTKTRVQVPANTELRDILTKYDNQLPFVWPQKLNAYIKTIARRAGITQKERISTVRGGQEKEEYVERCELVHTHTARKTGATLMYNEGVDLYDIMKITGHSSLDTLKKYIKATGGEVACRIANKYDYFR